MRGTFEHENRKIGLCDSHNGTFRFRRAVLLACIDNSATYTTCNHDKIRVIHFCTEIKLEKIKKQYTVSLITTQWLEVGWSIVEVLSNTVTNIRLCMSHSHYVVFNLSLLPEMQIFYSFCWAIVLWRIGKYPNHQH